jgi:hypothetical protein
MSLILSLARQIGKVMYEIKHGISSVVFHNLKFRTDKMLLSKTFDGKNPYSLNEVHICTSKRAFDRAHSMLRLNATTKKRSDGKLFKFKKFS